MLEYIFNKNININTQHNIKASIQYKVELNMSKTVANKYIWVERQAEEMGLKNGFFFLWSKACTLWACALSSKHPGAAA